MLLVVYLLSFVGKGKEGRKREGDNTSVTWTNGQRLFEAWGFTFVRQISSLFYLSNKLNIRFKYLFICFSFACAGSSLLCMGFL